MAENMDIAKPADISLLKHLSMRDENGEIRPEFVAEISRAVHEADTAVLRGIVGELHEADLGDLIAALEPDDRVSLVELTGTDFDFSALNEVDETVREEILEELEPETVAEGVRELESDDAVELLEALDDTPGVARDIVLLNAGAALYAAGLAGSIQDGIERARAVVASGAARAKLDAFVAATRQLAAGAASPA